MQDSKQHIIEIINTIISEQVGLESHEIEPHAEFLADYNADTDTLTAVIIELEHHFPDGEVHFRPDEINDLVSIKDLYDLTLEKLNEV